MTTLIPKYYFDPNSPQNAINSFYKYIDNKQFNNFQVPYTNFDQKIEAIRTLLINQFIQNTGLDITDRLIPISKIHIMQTNDFDNIRRELNYPLTSRGMFSTKYLHIFIKGYDQDESLRKETSLLRSICHELIHSLAYILINFTQDNTYNVVTHGFKTKSSEFFCLTEGLVDISVLQIIKHYWKTDLVLKPYAKDAFFEVPYYQFVMILDAIIDLVCIKENITYVNFLSMLQKDFILHTKYGIDLIEKVLGQERFNIFKNIGGNLDSKINVINTGKELGLLDFVKEVERAGKAYEYCTKL